jgi:hypothetical protein
MNFRESFAELDQDEQAIVAFVLAEIDECENFSCRSILNRYDRLSVVDVYEKAEGVADEECRWFSGSSLAEYFDWDRFIEDRLSVDEFKFNGEYVDIVGEV